MPANLYGSNDNYNLETSQVLPALIRKMHFGKCLMNNDWDSIRKDLSKRLIEGISGKSTDDEILLILKKYGIKRTTNNEQRTTITLWGTGTPRREFLHSDDLADACVFLMEKINFSDLKGSSKEIKNTHINIGTGENLEIRELSEIIKRIVGFEGEIIWDNSKPDGTKQKLLNVGKINKLGWKNLLSLEAGVKKVFNNY